MLHTQFFAMVGASFVGALFAFLLVIAVVKWRGQDEVFEETEAPFVEVTGNGNWVGFHPTGESQ